jgi:hypothetical protein
MSGSSGTERETKMTTNSTTEVTCPRCHGFDNAFTRFGHIAHGKCLRCLGAKTVEVDTAKLNARADASLAKAHAYYSARPYIVAVDGMETIASNYKTWEEARASHMYGLVNDDGDTFSIAKWDGECFRYRNGDRVKLSN